MPTPNPANLTSLQAAKDAACANLASVLASPKPTYGIDGQSVSWESYVAMLTAQVEKLNELIQIESLSAGPLQYVTGGLT